MYSTADFLHTHTYQQQQKKESEGEGEKKGGGVDKQIMCSQTCTHTHHFLICEQ